MAQHIFCGWRELAKGLAKAFRNEERIVAEALGPSGTCSNNSLDGPAERREFAASRAPGR